MTNSFTEYPLEGYAEVHLKDGYAAKIDILDLPKVREIPGTWGFHFSRKGDRYASFSTTRASKKYAVLLHRHIMDPPGHAQVDHINHNTLDNRRQNLRIVSRSLNALNRAKASGAHPSRQGWASAIMYRGKNIYLGFYATKEAAEFAHAGASMALQAVEETR